MRTRLEAQCQFSHPISHRTPHYGMGKDSIRLLVAIEKRLNFQTQRDRKIQDGIDGNSLGNRWRRMSGKCAFCKTESRGLEQ